MSAACKQGVLPLFWAREVVVFAGVLVADAKQAFEASTANGAIAVQPPTVLRDEADGSQQTIAEVSLYGDCVLRFVSGDHQVRLTVQCSHVICI